MKQITNLLVITTLLLLWCVGANAQSTPQSQKKSFRIAIFAPLFLDSVYNGNSYRYGKEFPKFAFPGLDFIQGAQIALDSLPIPNTSIDAHIFDTKSDAENIPTLLLNKKLDNIDLIIASAKDQDFVLLANFAKTKNIPFISATYPNDGGVSANPFLLIVNPTLRTHCEAIYTSILQKYNTDNIYLVRRAGTQENSVEENFRRINEPAGRTPRLKIEVINVEEDFSIIKDKLDSNRKSIIIGGSLNEGFANSLATYLQSINTNYEITLIGMPNWDGFSSLTRNAKLKKFPILFTTPFFNSNTDMYSRRIREIYLDKYKGVPTDMAYKGFELTLQFTKLLSNHPNDFISHLNDSNAKVFTDFQFKPIFLNKNAALPDYFENKNVYFIKILNGSYSRAW
jgi:hypothetical protein